MPLLKKIRIDERGGILGIWKVTESADDLLELLSEKEYHESKISQIGAASRKLEYLGVRVLLKTLLGKECCISHYESGKPYLPHEEYHISISHTKGYIAVALSKNEPVGIDIEYFAERVTKVTSRFVTASEAEYVAPYTGDEKLYMLLLIWSAKETVFKMMDSEEVDFLNHIAILPFGLLEEGHFMAREFKSPSRCTFPINYFLDNDFVCTWSCSKC